VVLREGRKRQVRRMLAAVGHQVRRLVRVRIAGVELADLPPGAARPLSRRELAALRGTA
jgi:23S rRNA pseudouridine2605 synthase